MLVVKNARTELSERSTLYEDTDVEVVIGRTLTCSLVDYSTTIVNAGVYGASFDGCSQPSTLYDESRSDSYWMLP